jgi:hypothetical protein
VTKTAIIVSHDSDCEHGLSNITNLVDERNSAIGLNMINSGLTVKSGLAVYENQPAKAQITQDSIELDHISHRNFITQEQI